MLKAGEVKTGVKFKLVVVWFHVCTELIEGLVVFFLFKVCQFMDDDHA